MAEALHRWANTADALAFTAPTDVGGGAITSYTITAVNDAPLITAPPSIAV